jgi:hypothetical protein
LVLLFAGLRFFGLASEVFSACRHFCSEDCICSGLFVCWVHLAVCFFCCLHKVVLP